MEKYKVVKNRSINLVFWPHSSSINKRNTFFGSFNKNNNSPYKNHFPNKNAKSFDSKNSNRFLWNIASSWYNRESSCSFPNYLRRFFSHLAASKRAMYLALVVKRKVYQYGRNLHLKRRLLGIQVWVWVPHWIEMRELSNI